MKKHYLAIGITAVALVLSLGSYKQAKTLANSNANDQHTLANAKQEADHQKNTPTVNKKVIKSNIDVLNNRANQITKAQQWFMDHAQDQDQGKHEPDYTANEHIMKKNVVPNPGNAGQQATTGVWLSNLKGAGIEFQIKGQLPNGNYQVQWVYVDSKSHDIWGIVTAEYSAQSGKFSDINCLETDKGGQQNQLIGGK